MLTDQTTLPPAPGIHLNVESPTRPSAQAACRCGTNRARRPLHVNLPDGWLIFGVNERIGNWALDEAYAASPGQAQLVAQHVFGRKIRELRIQELCYRPPFEPSKLYAVVQEP